jgi:DNA-directed RNA polymerase
MKKQFTDVGRDYLYIHGANNQNFLNISKGLFNDRINWVNINYDQILNFNRDFILNADSKLPFVAFV